MSRLIYSLFLIYSLAACSLGGGPAPQDHFYKIPEVVLDAQANSSFDELVIKPVKSSGLYHERAILFIESDKPLELQRYHYSFWSTTPAELIHNALYEGLQSSNIARHVARDLSASRADYIIDSRIVHFERMIKNQPANHLVSIEVALEISVRKGGVAGVVWTKRYSIRNNLQTTDMHSSAQAFGEALKTIAAQLVADLIANSN